MEDQGDYPLLFREKGGPINLSLTGNTNHKPTSSPTQNKHTLGAQTAITLYAP